MPCMTDNVSEAEFRRLWSRDLNGIRLVSSDVRLLDFCFLCGMYNSEDIPYVTNR